MAISSPLALKLRVRAGSLYVGLLDQASSLIQRVVPKHTFLGRLLARVKQGLRRAPLPRATVLLEALSQNRVVRFVQIGANDGILEDPLRPFILRHDWRGLLIEPLPHIFEHLRATYAGRPHLVLENVAVSRNRTVADFYYVTPPEGAHSGLPQWHAGLGSLSRETLLKHAEQYPEISRHLAQVRVQCVPFEELCAAHSIGVVDLIACDAEGHDFEILQTIDFELHRPVVVLFEHHHMTPDQLAACDRLLAQHGYDWFREALNTVCFRAKDGASANAALASLWRELKELAWIPI